MRRILSLTLLLVVTTVVMAQHMVTGTVVEAGTDEPMVQTTVRLLKNNGDYKDVIEKKCTVTQVHTNSEDLAKKYAKELSGIDDATL